jgi:hypothetical protein
MASQTMPFDAICDRKKIAEFSGFFLFLWRTAFGAGQNRSFTLLIPLLLLRHTYQVYILVPPSATILLRRLQVALF